MSDRDSYRHILSDTDYERLKFWREQRLITPISGRLLLLTNWFAANQDEIYIGEKGNEIIAGKLRDLVNETSIIFKAPQTREGKARLEAVLLYLREKQRQIDHVESLISRREGVMQQKGTGITSDEAAKIQKDVKHLRKLISDIMSPKPRTEASINTFLDTMRFEITEVGLAELRYQSPVRRLSLEERIREMDND
ncbi:MAG: hypothetical protein KIY12_07970 [Thermoplasmata archaeon]|uniref:Uncharacterized protein n=1 Tax=Candidatus Sysuiplasma superficiale TaxID=2823368 RepID=A0A8J7YU00_9ARCH|nr:hypothetical protein [Candidatus Sysuiplasma superficiale]MBX8644639.1 hypothetical protein [Candidatus Sysuiplasma superficiale]